MITMFCMFGMKLALPRSTYFSMILIDLVLVGAIAALIAVLL